MLKLFVAIIVALTTALAGTAAVAASFYECTAVGVEKNGSRKAEVRFRLNSDGVIVSGQIVIPESANKSAFPGGEYLYADGSKLTRDQGEYEWVMEANCAEKSSKARSSVLARKYKIQNIAEMQLKNKSGSVWFIFPHGWEYKQVSEEK